jgi:hypothetical protein
MGGRNRKYACMRCGIEREVHEERCKESLCRDCYQVDPVWRRISNETARRWREEQKDRRHTS